MDIQIIVAQPEHTVYAQAICDLIEESAKARGTGIAKRKPAYVEEKMTAGKAIIALIDGKIGGFSYIETWGHGEYVANSGLIVNPEYRRLGLARKIKAAVFKLSRKKYPSAKIFGITTSLPVMKINSDLGYRPVTFSELTQDDAFWEGCKTCPNFDILTRNERQMCLCTAMMAPSAEEVKRKKLEKLEKKRDKIEKKIRR
ncbi:GNAT family N-acetyltransferase [Neolewinella antarctica]|uniref:GNAT superfamily N-acetyltransferase n=1 Tax=Neolewinella antarctica TaxID=442734 RepID=A0ABX0XG07_9BACT|nr:GNAT family N-acetyltransferase [Neolewinella antarctica]NJC27809.1 GNAT superfamily N-acetyltransferase [Neolewinella antarctica]